MTKVIVVIGPGSIGQAIARRVGAGKLLLLADLRQENAEAAAKTLSEAGFEVTTTTVDVSSRASVEALVAKAVSLGDVHGLIPLAFHRHRPRLRRSLKSIFTASRSCWKRSAT